MNLSAITAPAAAPEDIPRRSGVAKLFLNKFWHTSPDKARIAPATNPKIVRGTRKCQKMKLFGLFLKTPCRSMGVIPKNGVKTSKSRANNMSSPIFLFIHEDNFLAAKKGPLEIDLENLLKKFGRKHFPAEITHLAIF